MKPLLLFLFIFLFFIPLNLRLNSQSRIYYIFHLITKLAMQVNLEKGLFIKEAIDYGPNLFNLSRNYINAIDFENQPIELSIKFKQLEKLRTIRNKTLKDGILTRSNKDEVKAKIIYKDKIIPVNVRLKGDLTDHLIGDKWSFRIKTKQDKSFLGMREFSLHHPRTRNYINEFIFHKLLEYERLPYLRYKFLTLKLNGKNLGTYAIEEHFNKELIENSGLREGPILKFNEEVYWKEILRNNEFQDNKNMYDPANYKYWGNISTIDVFNKNQILTDENLSLQTQTGIKLLNEFLLGNKKVNEVFDVKKTAIYFAVNDILGSSHSYYWTNIRFYYDPIIARLIPIGFDSTNDFNFSNQQLSIDRNPFGIFDDINFLREYINQLERLTENNYFSNFLKSNNYSIESELRNIHKSYPYVSFKKEYVFKNIKRIRNRLNPITPISIFNIKDLSQNQIKIEFINKSIFPIKILTKNFKIYKNNYFSNDIILNGSNRYSRNKPTIITLKKSSIQDSYKLPYNKISTKLNVEYSLLGSENNKQDFLDFQNLYPNVEITKNIIRRKVNINDFDFLKVDKINKQIILESGNWIINEILVLPKDYKFIVKPDTQISTVKNGLIIARGPISLLGTKDYPIKLKGFEKGKGILVINANQESFLKHVSFENLFPVNDSSINITGAVTFYNSPVSLSDCIFNNFVSEDALNLFRSQFSIERVRFNNTKSDALDIDFSDGTINNVIFDNIGNDAIDISGSKVNLRNARIINSGDKAISAGENSTLNASNIFISDSNIGVASKDLSSVNLKSAIILNTKYCYAAFQKKPEYGPASIKILFDSNNPQFRDINCSKNNKYLLEGNSRIISYLSNFEPNFKDIKQFLYE